MSELQKSHIQYRVPYADTDRMGVVYYGNYLTYFEIVRGQYMVDMGYPYIELEKDGFALPVIEAHVNYKYSAGYDDVLDFYSWIGKIKGVRMQMHCQVKCEDRILAEGYTIHAFVNMKTMKPAMITSKFMTACKKYAGVE